MEQKEEMLEEVMQEVAEDEVVEPDVEIEEENLESESTTEEEEEDPISKIIVCTSFGLCAGLAIGCCINPLMSGVGLVLGAAVGFLCGKGMQKNGKAQ